MPKAAAGVDGNGEACRIRSCYVYDTRHVITSHNDDVVLGMETAIASGGSAELCLQTSKSTLRNFSNTAYIGYASLFRRSVFYAVAFL
jgi:hypothetical protein